MNPNDLIWKPNVTVAAVIEQDGKFLLIEEETDSGLRLNQPAGHLEPNESLAAGAIRETLEESAYHFEPRSLVGVYHYRHERKEITYLRFAFAGELTGHERERVLDAGIVRTVWMSPEEIRTSNRLRTPLVLRCIDDYLSGRRYPLDLLAYCA